MQPLRIANTCAFWGDDIGASARTVTHDPNIDFLTLDYLAEVSMSILAKLKQRNADAGFAGDFLEVISSLIPAWKDGGNFRIVTNAGGLNPLGCGKAAAKILRDAGLAHKKIGVVTGDDVLPQLMLSPQNFPHLEIGRSLDASRLVTANAYVGAAPIVEAIQQGADIVITGRIADPSLTVAPCIAHFGWKSDDFSALAGATVAGHLIECGTQVTGGISTDWLKIDSNNIGFPIVEICADGSSVVTKPPGTGGVVNEWTVKEQLLYELGDPARYLSPDVTASFLTLKVEDLGNNRVRVSGASGAAPPETLKVSATLRAGYKASGMLTIIGRGAVDKAAKAAAQVYQRLAAAAAAPQRFHTELLGSCDSQNGILPRAWLWPREIVLRISAADERKDVVEQFSRLIVPLVTAGPPGTTGYFDGRPAVREVFEYWPCLIDRRLVQHKVEIISP